MYKRIMVPTDGSDITRKAVATALELAKLCGAGVETLSVKEPFAYSALSELQPIPPQEYYDAQQRVATQRVRDVEQACQQVGVSCSTATVEAVHPWEAIVRQAEQTGCDLIVMGSHGRRGMAAILLGSETQRVLIHTKLPVLVVR
jgi:nucleotide-binding universal stress UspA family protein